MPEPKAARKSPGPRKRSNDGPTPEEMIDIEVARRVSAILDAEQLDRMMLTRLANTASMLAGCRCVEHPLEKHVDTAMHDAIRAICERIERIAGNDLPPPSMPKWGD